MPRPPALVIVIVIAGCRHQPPAALVLDEPQPRAPASAERRDDSDPANAPDERADAADDTRESVELTPEELAAARRMVGHASLEEIEAENARMFEQGAREYIKTRMPEYRKLLAKLRALLDDVDAAAPKWTSERAFERFHSGYEARATKLRDVHDQLTDGGVEGGKTGRARRGHRRGPRVRRRAHGHPRALRRGRACARRHRRRRHARAQPALRATAVSPSQWPSARLSSPSMSKQCT